MRRIQETHRLNGIVVKVYPYSDADLVLRVLSDGEGKVAVIAKHARRSRARQQSALDLFDHAIFELKGEFGQIDKLLTLVGYQSISGFSQIRSDLDRFAAASVVAEAADILHQERVEGDSSGYKIVSLGLQAISDSESSIATFKACFFTLGNLLDRAGYLDRAAVDSVSASGLLRLLDQIENRTDREMTSRNILTEALRGLKKNLVPLS